jgi:hypothetical protein
MAAHFQRDGPDAHELGREQPVRLDAAGSGDTGPGARPAEHAADGPGLRELQLAEHARYRQVVEVSGHADMARDAWARAVPVLRAEWEAHRERYPAPVREAASTQPDGGWHGAGGRRLSPEQNAEADKCAADLRDEARQTIWPAIERVAAADPGRRLAGLDHMLKGEDRLKEKIADALRARPGLTVAQAMTIVPDPVRFTLCYPSERYAAAVASDVGRLISEGFELIKLKNLWHSEQYKGINSQWQVPGTGTRLEVQFHTPESHEVKELTHDAYERIRTRMVDPQERSELERFQRRANMWIVTPPGTYEIADYPRKTE